VEELRLIRFWLRAISQTCFQRVTSYRLFSPELIQQLFPAPVYSHAIQFRAAELFTFYDLPPLAYGPLVCARAVKFYGYYPFPDLLHLVCTFAVAPQKKGDQFYFEPLQIYFLKIWEHFYFSHKTAHYFIDSNISMTLADG
jgi:hypothetical protein